MDGSIARQQPTLSLQQEFAGSRLEKQILIRAFELVMPAQRHDRVADEQSSIETDGSQVNPLQSKGA